MNSKPFGNQPKKVIKFDLETKKVIEEFTSISKASQSVKKPSAYSSIYACLIGRTNSAYGYGWKYQ